MSLSLYAHPFSSYSQKVLVALYENATPFEWRLLESDEETLREWKRLWPLAMMPVLRDGERTLVESSVILEYLQLRYPGPVRLLPEDPLEALEARFMDRVFDNHVMGPMQAIVYDFRRPPEQRHPPTVAEARAKLDQVYEWLDGRLAGRPWAAGDAFSLADCAAAPSLFYADWTHEMAPRFGNLRAYRARLLERPSFRRAVNEARPYRKWFPPGAPDRD